MSLPQAIQAEVKVNYDKPTQALTLTDSKDVHYSFSRAAVAQIIKLGDQSIRLSFGHSSTEPGYRILIHALKENSAPTELEVFTYPVKLSPNATLIINLEKNGDFENITAGYVGTVEVKGTTLNPNQSWNPPLPPALPATADAAPAKPLKPLKPARAPEPSANSAAEEPAPEPAAAPAPPCCTPASDGKTKAPASTEAAPAAPVEKPAVATAPVEPAPVVASTAPAAESVAKAPVVSDPSLTQSFLVTPQIPRNGVPDVAVKPMPPDSAFSTVEPPPPAKTLTAQNTPALEVLPPPPPAVKNPSSTPQGPSFTAVPATWPMCLVLEVKGDGTALTPSGKTVRLQAGQTLVQGVRITTLPDARARFYLSPGGLFELGTDSVATLGNIRVSDKTATEKTGTAKTSVYVEKGLAIFNNFTEYQGAKSYLRVLTPHGVLSAHETNFSVSVTQDTTVANVLDGALMVVDNPTLSNNLTMKDVSLLRPYQRIALSVAAPNEVIRTPVQEQRLTDRIYVQTAMVFMAARPQLLTYFRRTNWKVAPGDVEDQISMDQTARRSSWPGRIYEQGIDQVDLSFDEVNQTL